MSDFGQWSMDDGVYDAYHDREKELDAKFEELVVALTYADNSRVTLDHESYLDIKLEHVQKAFDQIAAAVDTIIDPTVAATSEAKTEAKTMKINKTGSVGTQEALFATQYRRRRQPNLRRFEAFRITTESRNSQWPGWLQSLPASGADCHMTMYVGKATTADPCMMVNTLRGSTKVNWGDWIIREDDGELRVCPDKFFNDMYEAVSVTNTGTYMEPVDGYVPPVGWRVSGKDEPIRDRDRLITPTWADAIVLTANKKLTVADVTAEISGFVITPLEPMKVLGVDDRLRSELDDLLASFPPEQVIKLLMNALQTRIDANIGSWK